MRGGPLPIAVIGLLTLGGAAPTDERSQVPPCSSDRTVPPSPGEVVRLLELHKDLNPENVLVVYTYADSRCRLIGSVEESERLVDMYWRMNARSPEECYKPTHPMIKSETLQSLAVRSLSADRKSFRIEITQLDQVENDLPTREVEILLERAGSVCKAEVRLPLESRDGAVMRLQQINAKGEYELGIPRRALKELELVGIDGQNRRIRRIYRSRESGQ